MSDTKTTALPPGVPWEVGQVREVEFHLSSSTIKVDCLVTDTRQVYGRTEWQVTPVAGSGSTWCTEKGPSYMPPSRHDRNAK